MRTASMARFHGWRNLHLDPGDHAAAQRAQGTRDARVVMDLTTDQFLVITDTTN
ncbi:hypothetical protein [Streptomyces sp. NPDC101150]|uniref:hypothetical protein n=1 Tax=Streptomyces sp. NPDC101150 TaxID=3366114 RepID=UPI003808EF30